MRSIILVTACVMALSAPATAAIRIATYTGFVVTINAIGPSDIIGSPEPIGEYDRGFPYIARFVYDTEAVGATREFVPGLYDRISGAIVAFSLEFNGVKNSNYSVFGGSVNVDRDRITHSVGSQKGLSNNTTFGMTGFGNIPTLSPSLNTKLPTTILPQEDDNPRFLFDHYAGGEEVYTVQGQLFPRTLSISVPEPATWSLMIAGFGMVGATFRRRRVSLTV